MEAGVGVRVGVTQLLAFYWETTDPFERDDFAANTMPKSKPLKQASHPPRISAFPLNFTL